MKIMDYSLLLGIHYRSKANVKGEYQKWHQSCLTLPLCGRPCTQLAHAAPGSTSGFKRPSVHLNADDALVSVLLAAARCVPTRCLCLTYSFVTCVHCRWGPRTAPGANGEACPGNERKGELANHAHSGLLAPPPPADPAYVLCCVQKAKPASAGASDGSGTDSSSSDDEATSDGGSAAGAAAGDSGETGSGVAAGDSVAATGAGGGAGAGAGAGAAALRPTRRKAPSRPAKADGSMRRVKTMQPKGAGPGKTTPHKRATKKAVPRRRRKYVRRCCWFTACMHMWTHVCVCAHPNHLVTIVVLAQAGHIHAPRRLGDQWLQC